MSNPSLERTPPTTRQAGSSRLALRKRDRKRVTGFVVVAGVAAVLAAAWLAFRPDLRTSGQELPPRDSTLSAVLSLRPEHPDTVLEARLRAIVGSAYPRTGIVAKNLRSGAVARVNPNVAVPLLSVVKLPLAIVVLDKVDKGEWTIDMPVTLLPGDMHPRGWVGDRYPRGGGPVSLHKLVFETIVRSDNSSADALMRLIGGPHVVTEWLERHGIRDFRVDRTERGLGNDWYGLPAGADTMGSAEEIRKIRAAVPAEVHHAAARAMLLDPRDTGTAQACVHILEELWDGDLLSDAMTDTLQSIMARCKTAPRRLPGMLPKGTYVARKTGTGGMSEGVSVAINDVGVIRLPNGDEVAIAVLVGEPRGSVRRAEMLIARAARAVYDAWGGGGPVASR